MPERGESVGSLLDEAYYYGTWREVGHRMFLPNMRRAAHAVEDEFRKVLGAHPDGGFTPKLGKEGAAVLHHINGWTVLSSNDYSVDSRGNSHSTFILRGTFDFEEALRRAGEQFPEVLARIKRPVLQGGSDG